MGPHYYHISDEEWSMIDSNLASKLYDRATKMIENSEDVDIVYDTTSPHKINVNLVSGRCKSLPNYNMRSFLSQHVQLSQGECRSTLLTVDPHVAYCTLRMCYRGDALCLDNGSSKDRGTIVLPQTSLWRVTQEYNDIQTAGYAHLDNVHLTVRSL